MEYAAQGGTGATTAAAARTALGTNDAANITAGTLPVARGGTGLPTVAANKLLGTGTTVDSVQAISVGSGLNLSGGTLSSSLTGSGSNDRLAFWSSSNGLSSDADITRNFSALYAGSFYARYSTFGSITSVLSFVASSGLSPRASFEGSRTLNNNIENIAGGQLVYWNSSTKNLTFQFSRGAHKEDVKKIDMSIDDLMKWRPVEFKWKEKFGGTPDIGFIAEEVASVYPLAATYDQAWEYIDDKTGEYAVDEGGMPKRLEGDPVVAGVKYEKAWIPMMAAVQDFYKRFQSENSELRNQLTEVKGRLAALEGSSQ